MVTAGGIDILGYNLGWMRMVVFVSFICTVYTVVAAYFVRDIQVLSDVPLKDREFCQFKPVEFHILDSIKEVMSQKKFWRLTGVVSIFVGVRMTFRHLDATFPKYFIRTYGPDAPFELMLGLNPILEMVGTPICTG